MKVKNYCLLVYLGVCFFKLFFILIVYRVTLAGRIVVFYFFFMAEIDGRLDTAPDDSVELTKKRKLQDDLTSLSLPLCKHQCGVGFRSFGLSKVEEHEKIKEIVTKGVRDPSEELEESESDSNSVSEGYGTTMTMDLKDEDVRLPQRSLLQYLPSTSSNTSTNSTCRSSIISSKIKMVKQLTSTKQDSWDNFEQLHPEFRGTEKQNSYEEAYDDCILSELEYAGIEFSDAGFEESMLYSNDVLPNAMSLSSENRIEGQDSRMATRKPTIDQEFEEYFSTLML